MPKNPPKEIDTAPLEEIRRLAQARVLSFNRPKFPLKFLVETFGLSSTTVRNWTTRGILPLDADEGREDRGHRLFSERDCLALTCAQHLSRLGVPTPAFPRAIDQVLKSAEDWMSRPHVYMNASGNPIHRELLMLWPVGDQWFSRLLAGSPAALLPEDLPECFVTLDVTGLLRRTLESLGLLWGVGTAKELRKIAERGHKPDKDK